MFPRKRCLWLPLLSSLALVLGCAATKPKPDPRERINYGSFGMENDASYFIRLHQPAECIEYCKKLKLGSVGWRCALCELVRHEADPDVCRYVSQYRSHPDAHVRDGCYTFYSRANRDDMLEQAKIDLNDESEVVRLHNSYKAKTTISEVASEYIAWRENVQKRARSQ